MLIMMRRAYGNATHTVNVPGARPHHAVFLTLPLQPDLVQVQRARRPPPLLPRTHFIPLDRKRCCCACYLTAHAGLTVASTPSAVVMLCVGRYYVANRLMTGCMWAHLCTCSWGVGMCKIIVTFTRLYCDGDWRLVWVC